MDKRIRFGMLAMVLLLGACASKEPRSATDAMAQGGARTQPAAITCYDSFGEPIPEEQVAASRRSGQPPCGEYYVVQRRRAAPSAIRGPSMEPGSINLPRSPIPLPGGFGVMR